MFNRVSFWFDWILLGTAGVAFLIGTFVAPGYESHLRNYGGQADVFPVSDWAINICYILLVCESLLWGLRFALNKYGPE